MDCRRFLFALLTLVSLSACDLVTDPPELIQKYSVIWDIQSRQPDGLNPLLSYSSSLRLMPGGDILVSTANYTNDEYTTRFLKLDASGSILQEASFKGYSAYPQVLDDGRIVSLSDSLRVFTSGLQPLLVSPKPFERFGLMAYTPEVMIYTDYTSSSMSLASYDYTGNQLWSKPARALGCGGNSMRIEPLAPNAGMFTRSIGQNSDTLRFSVFSIEDGKPVWSKTYLGSSFFGTSDPDALSRIGVSSLLWMPRGESVWIFGADAADEKILVRSVSRDGIGRKFTIDLIAHPFGSLPKGLRTVDGGFLFGLNGDLTSDAYAYRLAKSDGRGNIGWVGTFTTLGIDFLVDMLELEDGTVIVMTGLGTVTAYRPQY